MPTACQFSCQTCSISRPCTLLESQLTWAGLKISWCGCSAGCGSGVLPGPKLRWKHWCVLKSHVEDVSCCLERTFQNHVLVLSFFWFLLSTRWRSHPRGPELKATSFPAAVLLACLPLALKHPCKPFLCAANYWWAR